MEQRDMAGTHGTEGGQMDEGNSDFDEDEAVQAGSTHDQEPEDDAQLPVSSYRSPFRSALNSSAYSDGVEVYKHKRMAINDERLEVFLSRMTTTASENELSLVSTLFDMCDRDYLNVRHGHACQKSVRHSAFTTTSGENSTELRSGPGRI